ncbi:4a-hydroxytetrahydrobiopterin dehydratase [Jeotgalibacillus proteolyticus]|nr:4a-hydroxytetrahydrobiopterin dehydratase [Jeotgalibacillus proteolyticus]
MTLSVKQISDRLSTLENWEINEDGAIQKRYPFDQYLSGVEFSSAIANEAQRRTHYPVILINADSVMIKIKADDTKGLTEADFALAHAAERIYYS